MDYLKKLQELSEEGACPCLLNDDNGHWALTFEGYQDVPMGDKPIDINTSFFVEKKYWKNTIDKAIEFSLKEHIA